MSTSNTTTSSIFVGNIYCRDTCPCEMGCSERLTGWSDVPYGGMGYEVDLIGVLDSHEDVHVLVRLEDTCDCRYVGKSVPIKAFASEANALMALAAVNGPFHHRVEKVSKETVYPCDRCDGDGTVPSLDPDVEFEHCDHCQGSGHVGAEQHRLDKIEEVAAWLEPGSNDAARARAAEKISAMTRSDQDLLIAWLPLARASAPGGFKPKPQRDFCVYCGVDQGEIIPPSTLGSMRQGWDCWRGCGN